MWLLFMAKARAELHTHTLTDKNTRRGAVNIFPSASSHTHTQTFTYAKRCSAMDLMNVETFVTESEGKSCHHLLSQSPCLWFYVWWWCMMCSQCGAKWGRRCGCCCCVVRGMRCSCSPHEAWRSGLFINLFNAAALQAKGTQLVASLAFTRANVNNNTNTTTELSGLRGAADPDRSLRETTRVVCELPPATHRIAPIDISIN